VNIAIGLIAAMLIGVGLVLQQHAAEQAPKSYFLRLRLIAELLHQRRWLVGVGIMAAGQLLSAWTVGHLTLSVAEPLLATNLLFALIVAVPLSGERLHRSELVGAVLLSAGVAALSVSRSVSTQGLRFGSAAYWPAAAAIGAIALCLIRAGWRREGQQRALLTGTASGLIFGISDALTRQTVQLVSNHSILVVLTSWPAYCLVATSLVALWLMESSFNAAPLHASLPAITAAEPVAGILLGVVVFGDVIHVSPGLIALQAAGLVTLVTGVILVARAPVLSNLRPRRLIPGRPARDARGSRAHDKLLRRLARDKPGRLARDKPGRLARDKPGRLARDKPLPASTAPVIPPAPAAPKGKEA
jgi:drug/metabolite transporter (DMT)-like permease